MENKYGRVFVHERDGETIRPKLPDSVVFSNTDHKLYDLGGSLSPLYENYKGRPYSIQFKLTQDDINGKEVEFEGKINMPYKLGHIEHQDFESVPQATENVMERLKSLKILSDNEETDDGYRVFRELNGAAMVASYCPGWKISDMKLLHIWIDAYFILDEHMDKAKSRSEMPYKQSEAYWAAIQDLIERKPGEDYSEILKSNRFPDQYIKLINNMIAIRNEMWKKEELMNDVMSTYKTFHSHVALENCQEWKEKENEENSLLFRALHPELRPIVAGARLLFEMICFDQGIKVSQKVRNSFLFDAAYRTYCQQATLLNDLMSLQREMAVGTYSNDIYILHQKDGLSLHDALQKGVDEINERTNLFLEVGEMLFLLHGEDEEVAKVVNVMKGIMHGNIQWHAISRRYHPNMIHDCIIELE